MLTLQRTLNILFILVLCGVALASYTYQYVTKIEPCPLCLMQRLALSGIVIALLMNLRFGIKIQNYGLAILSALLGRVVCLRQIGLHVCPEIGSFGIPILGFDLYLWSFFVFTSSIFACAVLLIIKGYSKQEEYPPTWGIVEKVVFVLVFLVTLTNTITTYLECGLFGCL